MGEHLINSLLTIATAIIGVAIIAVLVSQRAQTIGVIQAASGALANDISAAVSPVTGAQAQIYTGGGGGFGFSGFTGLGAPVGSFGG